MKKAIILMSCLVIFNGISNLCADLKPNTHIISIQTGGSLPQLEFEFESEKETRDSADMGLSISGQYLYHITPNFGFGAEAGYSVFGSKDYNKNSKTYFSQTKIKIKSEANLIFAEAIARYVLLPQEMFRPYVISGLGLSNLETNISGENYIKEETTLFYSEAYNKGSLKTNETGVSLSIGAGLEYDINEHFVTGINVKWRYIGASSSSNNITIKSGSTLDALFSLGYKFEL